MFLLDLDRVDPQFRIIADKLFFTDNKDLDTTNLKSLLGSNDYHYQYLFDRFSRSLEIFWDEDFWINRLDVLLSLQSKRLDSDVGSILLQRFRRLIDYRVNPSPKIDSEFIQFKAWTKVLADRKGDITSIREFFLNMIYNVQVSKINTLLVHFTPHLFQSLTEYLELLGKRVSTSARSVRVLRDFESQGVPVDKSPLLKQARNLLIKRAINRPNRRSLFALMDDKEVMAHLKTEYKPEDRARLVSFIQACDYKEIEEHHLRNVKNILEIDDSVVDELFNVYADSLWARGIGHRGANIKRLIRLCKTFPIFSPKKVLVYLSKTGKMSDVKPLVSAFPELKTLTPFI